ncbi:hypothetical protein [Vibrio phage VP16T]|uniref:Uncharacterized protein n=1 Tax=Vibrio phage VP16T TaxID=238892 RepID=A0ACD6B856_9CAUD|nr:Chain A, Crystal structure of PDF from the Vibrio parahaemolyticus bacteriophage VP16T - crystal form I [Vibrio phage VP16T]5MTC_B Chain B, Crystal structure of PDF from the Vibrio parahaemolyticus bacteriophage VP16T - crystal form I [Vibrio phage VP16T]5MTD_A Chain A, Crystal structure of PDF from the Vibrio parahaemolyticus bacteriophage VP16T - crystal form II [Vibrio phage VP16T]5MTD_B Chain B, Crystal structure of PDF from the Vibrio parahaemolyticus bacteriophage VP16T - crystal form I
MKILKDDAPELHAIAAEVPHGEDVKDLVLDMTAAMTAAGGIGLAGNQVGVLKRIIVLRCPTFKGCVINPIITRHTDGHVYSPEGCLSYPGKTVAKKRRNKVVVEGYDMDWQPITIAAKGLTAFCLQHEIDHLNGVTI